MEPLKGESLIKALSSGAPAVAVTDPRGTIEYASDAFFRLTGYSPTELEGKNIGDSRAGAHGQAYFETIAKNSLPGSVFMEEYVATRRDGTAYWVEERIVPLFEGSAKLSHFVCSLQDISRRKTFEKEAAESRDYLSTVINALPDLVYMKDEDHRYVMVNEEVCKETGRKLEDFIGKTDRDLFSKEEAEALWQRDARILEKGIEETADELVTDAAGVTHHNSSRKIRFTDRNGEKFLLGISRDITQLRKEEAEVAAAKEHLEQEVAERTKALREANSKLEKTIAELKEAKEELEQSQKEYMLLIESSRDSIVVMLPDYTLVYANKENESALGIPPEKLVGKKVSDIFPEQQWLSIKKIMDVAIESKSSQYAESNVTLPIGEKWFATWYVPKIDEVGKVESLFCFSRDITSQKQAEKKLAESKENYRVLVEESDDSIFTVTKDKIFAFCNPIGAKRFLKNPEDVMGRPVSEFFPESYGKISALLDEVFTTSQPRSVEMSFNMPAGGTGWFSIHFTPLFGKNHGVDVVSAVARDITLQRVAQKDIYSSHQMLSLILNNIPQRIFWKDRNFRYLGCNTPFAHDAGFMSADQVIGKKDEDMRWKKLAAQYMRDDEAVMASGLSKLNFEETITAPDGTGLVWVRTSKTPLYDEKGEVIGILGSYEDITSEKEAMMQLKKFELSSEGVSDGIVLLDRQGVVQYANKTTEKITGYSRSELAGKPLVILSESATEEEAILALQDAARQGKGVMHERTLTRKSGEKYIAEVHIAPILSAQGVLENAVLTLRDVTEARAVDRAKTEFVSLASHQLRMPLTIINWYLEVLSDETKDKIDKKFADHLHEVAVAGKRMAHLVDALISTSRIDMGTLSRDFKPEDLRDIVRAAVEGLEPEAKQRKVALDVDTTEQEAFMAMLDERTVVESIVAVVRNAIVYSPEESTVKVSLFRREGRVGVRVADSGIGIPYSIQAKVYDKFYRGENAVTKEPVGNGLDLYFAKALVENSKGTISFTSEEGKGTIFDLEFPEAK